MLVYDIVNKEYAIDSEHYGISYPGVVVIDNKGNVISSALFQRLQKAR